MPLIRRLAPALFVAFAACANPDAELDPESALREATLAFVPARCAGVVVGDGTHALTAAHCLEPGEHALELELYDGRRISGLVGAIDRSRDLVLLKLDRPAPVRPLAVAPELPVPGAALLFVGANAFAHPLQHVALERIGRCPSLPLAPGVLFTTLEGQPGDSGAPVVDEQLRVVGLVHGGAACHIAAPVAAFAKLVPAAP